MEQLEAGNTLDELEEQLGLRGRGGPPVVGHGWWRVVMGLCAIAFVVMASLRGIFAHEYGPTYSYVMPVLLGLLCGFTRVALGLVLHRVRWLAGEELAGDQGLPVEARAAAHLRVLRRGAFVRRKADELANAVAPLVLSTLLVSLVAVAVLQRT